MKYYKVAVLELKKTYTYFSERDVCIGSFCIVRVKGKDYAGVVIEKDNNVDFNLNYRSIQRVLDDFPVLPDFYMKFIKRISSYYFVDQAVFYSLAFPRKIFKSIEYRYCVDKTKEHLFFTEKEKGVVDVLKRSPATLKELKRIFGEDVADILKNLLKIGVVKREISNPIKGMETIKRKSVTLIKMPPESLLKEFEKSKPDQFRILEYLNKSKGVNFFLISELKDTLGISSYYPFNKLEEKGFVKCFYDYPSLIKENPSIKNFIKLTQYQEDFIERFKSNPEGIFYLFGVTGSGKTEVYLRCAELVIEQGKTVLYMVPEIGLTPSAVSRLKVRFGREIAIIHSGLSYGERTSEWLRVLTGKVKIVVGTRSSVFAPLKNLGLIIVDEEHDHSYKQERYPKYNALHCALFRANLSKIPVILGSATPLIESFYNARSGKYRLHILPKRAGGFDLPQVEIVDMRKEFERSGGKKEILAQTTIEEIKESLEKKEQVLVFVSRRGFAPFLMCRRCGYIEMCPNCSVSLTVHSKTDFYPLQCHYCGFGKEMPFVCPECGDNFIQMIGYGTERVEQKLKALFPTAKIERIDRDTVSTKHAFEAFAGRMKRREIDIVVGTQMIAKGHHFPYLRLAVVVDADSLVSFPDFRSSERAFSLLLQVGGRAGRELPGHVIIQTYKKEHYIYQFVKAHDYISFYEREIIFRKKAGYPPFSKLLVIEIKGVNEQRVKEFAECVGEKIKDANKKNLVKVMGPVKASLYRIHRKYRYHIILKSQQRRFLRALFKDAVLPFMGRKSADISLIPDFDPYSIM